MKPMWIGAFAGVAFVGMASAASISFTLDTEFSGAFQPEGYLTLTFDDVASNHVRLTIQGSLGNSGQEKATGVYFNIDPTLMAAVGFDMQLAFNSGASSGTFTTPTWDITEDGHKADGDGKYDVLVEFSTGGPASSIFNGAESAVFDITSGGTTSFDVHSFDFLSAPAGGHGPFKAAAHVQGVSQNGTNNGSSTGGSGWVAPGDGPVIIPLPQPVLIAGAGLFALAGIRRR